MESLRSSKMDRLLMFSESEDELDIDHVDLGPYDKENYNLFIVDLSIRTGPTTCDWCD